MSERQELEKLEEAACIAAVYACMAAEEEEQRRIRNAPSQTALPVWGQASILEQTGRRRITAAADLKTLLTAIVAVLATAAPAPALERIDFGSGSALRATGPALAQPAPLETDRVYPEANRNLPENCDLPPNGEDSAACPADLAGRDSQPTSELLPDGRPAAWPPPAARVKIGVALAAATDSCRITLPDGARLLDQFSGRLLADLPPSSLWTVRTENQKIVFEGQLRNPDNAHVVLYGLPGSTSPYRQASYMHTATGTKPLRRQTIQSASPKFSFPAVRIPTRPDVLREVAFVQPAVNTAGAPRPAAKTKSDTIVPFLPGYVFRPAAADGIVDLDGRAYRGELALKPAANGSKVLPVNLVDIEDYLLSVVPSEMPSSWPAEALKAQSIAARTYALANLGKHGKEGYDVKATTEDQVYLGRQSETQATNRAVFETQGLVLKHNGKPITAFFHSSGGGCTETSEHVFSRALPFLKSVEDPDHQSPHAFWTRNLPISAIEEALTKQGRDIGKILAILPLTRTPSQRLKDVLLSGTQSTLVVSGDELRRIFTLPSTLFNVRHCDDAYSLEGKGYGHGLGMSQWGAKFLAEQGYNAAEILSYYYKDVTLDAIATAP